MADTLDAAADASQSAWPERRSHVIRIGHAAAGSKSRVNRSSAGRSHVIRIEHAAAVHIGGVRS